MPWQSSSHMGQLCRRKEWLGSMCMSSKHELPHSFCQAWKRLRTVLSKFFFLYVLVSPCSTSPSHPHIFFLRSKLLAPSHVFSSHLPTLCPLALAKVFIRLFHLAFAVKDHEAGSERHRNVKDMFSSSKTPRIKVMVCDALS